MARPPAAPRLAAPVIPSAQQYVLSRLDPALSDYAAFDRALARMQSDIGAAEMHGLVCGLLCAPQPPPEHEWLVELLGEADNGDILYDECRSMLLACRDETAAQLASAGFDFRLLLPGDEEPLGVRGGALASWCGGFLYGLGLGGAGDTRSLPGEVREVIADLTEFTCLDADAEEGEEEERAFAELVEYVRVGVQLVHEALVNAEAASSVAPHRLH